MIPLSEDPSTGRLATALDAATTADDSTAAPGTKGASAKCTVAAGIHPKSPRVMLYPTPPTSSIATKVNAAQLSTIRQGRAAIATPRTDEKVTRSAAATIEGPSNVPAST